MDFYFTGQLLASFGPCQVGFWHNFECPCLGLVLFCFDWLKATDLVALGKTTLERMTRIKWRMRHLLFRGIVLFGSEQFSLVGPDLLGLQALLSLR